MATPVWMELQGLGYENRRALFQLMSTRVGKSGEYPTALVGYVWGDGNRWDA